MIKIIVICSDGGIRPRLATNSKTAISLLGALELEKLCLGDMASADLSFKFINIVADGSDVNKLAANTLTSFGWIGLRSI